MNTNELTREIIQVITDRGGFASRLNNTGIFDVRRQRYRPGTNRRGLPDIIGTFKKRSLFIEVKTGRDKLSEFQAQIRDEQIRAGGLYYVATDLFEFKEWFARL